MHNSTPETPTDTRPLLSEVAGQGDPIVLVPGGLSGWLSWKPHVARLSADRQAIRVQLRNIELAEAGQAIPESYRTSTEVDALRATAAILGLDRFDLVGWSYGGHVALEYALGYPARVRTLTVIEPPAYWVLREIGYPGVALAQLERDGRALVDRTVSVEDLERFLVMAGFGQPGDDFRAHPSWPVWVRNRQVLASYGRLWDERGSLDRVRGLDVPTLVVKGTETTGDMAAIADAIAATAPNATLLALPGDHACHLQNPDAFLTALVAHLGTGAGR